MQFIVRLLETARITTYTVQLLQYILYIYAYMYINISFFLKAFRALGLKQVGHKQDQKASLSMLANWIRADLTRTFDLGKPGFLFFIRAAPNRVTPLLSLDQITATDLW